MAKILQPKLQDSRDMDTRSFLHLLDRQRWGSMIAKVKEAQAREEEPDMEKLFKELVEGI